MSSKLSGHLVHHCSGKLVFRGAFLSKSWVDKSLLPAEQSIDSLRNKRRLTNCLYSAPQFGKAVQERPVRRAFTLGSVDPAGRMVPSTSSS